MRHYKSLWDLKTGRKPPFEGNIYTAAGQALEQVILDAIQAEYGLKMEDVDSAVHPDVDFLFASPDAIGTDRTGRRSIIEAKAPQTEKSRAKWGAPHEGWPAVPVNYRPQIVCQMAVWGLDHALVGAHLGAPEIAVYSLYRELDWEDELIERCGDFWQHVTRNEAPRKIQIPRNQWWTA